MMFATLPRKCRKSRGQVLLSILIAIAVFAILAHALFTLIASSYNLINLNKARITARYIAQEKIEIARNIAYADLGTVGGIPSGILAQQENIVRNGLNYTVKTSVVYIDDDFDNVAPIDTQPEDYKRVRIEINWQGLASPRKIPTIQITDITPGQTLSSTGGTLNILVFDADGLPVPQAEVRIQAPSLVPAIDVIQQTSDDGTISLPGTPSCDSCYEITVTKAGHNTDRTYSTAEVANPLKPHATVLDGQATQVSFSIDLTANMNITSVDSRENNFSAKGNVPFRLRGNKIIGTDVLGQPVYKYDNNHTTDASGNISFSNLEWDTYQVLMPSATSWDISGSSPLQPLSLLPDSIISFTFASEAHTDHSLLVITKDPSQDLIASVSARLYNGASYDETKLSGEEVNPDFGQAFFSNLEEKNYLIEATASGYLDYNGNFDVSGYTIGEVVLTPE